VSAFDAHAFFKVWRERSRYVNDLRQRARGDKHVMLAYSERAKNVSARCMPGYVVRYAGRGASANAGELLAASVRGVGGAGDHTHAGRGSSRQAFDHTDDDDADVVFAAVGVRLPHEQFDSLCGINGAA